ncbi:hypothetical protein Pcinc_004775 [Petrolisthes cinctipes]|uniref:Uncharacterized protein n=1 Tax=Petrolisthes cinctipes TaxID=88211 RepID=A0AAE1GGD7_PETCI|nr:hypothetical protein Pcinc_004775 [Petrolisthes cinctipes]
MQLNNSKFCKTSQSPVKPYDRKPLFSRLPQPLKLLQPPERPEGEVTRGKSSSNDKGNTMRLLLDKGTFIVQNNQPNKKGTAQEVSLLLVRTQQRSIPWLYPARQHRALTAAGDRTSSQGQEIYQVSSSSPPTWGVSESVTSARGQTHGQEGAMLSVDFWLSISVGLPLCFQMDVGRYSKSLIGINAM